MCAALADFRGVERRLQVLSATDRLVVVDDYAHHPTEVAASIEALRAAYPTRRLLVVFQPHLFSRTRDMAEAFALALGAADEAMVLPIYPSREAPLPGVTSELVVTAGADHVRGADTAAVVGRVADLAEPMVVAFMGAGDITRVAHHVADRNGSEHVGG